MTAFLSPQEFSMTVTGIIVIVVIVLVLGSLAAAHVWSESGDTEEPDKNTKSNKK